MAGRVTVRPDRDLSQETSSTASTLRYRFREDLKIVRAGEADVAGADVTVTDPRSNEQHVFTADEFALCRAADGTNSLAAIQQAYKAATGQDIAFGKLYAFFRGLRSKGLLDEIGATGGSESEGNQTVEIAEAASAASIALTDPAESDHGAGEGQDVLSAPTEPTIEALTLAGQRARRQRLMQSRLWADKPAGLRDTAKAPRTTETDAERDAKRNSTPETQKSESAEKAAPAAMSVDPATHEDLEDLDPPGLLRSSTAPGASPNQLDEGRCEAESGGPGSARIPGTPGGAGGSAGLGAAFAGGLGSGALREMFGGGEGRGGGAGLNFLAGLAARARAAQGDAGADVAVRGKEPARVYLFNPDAVLGFFAALAWPLKYVFVPLLLVVPVAAGIAYQHREILAQDIRSFDVSVVGTVILGLVIANLIGRLTQGTFIRGFGAKVKQFGIALTLGIPRFFVDLGGIATLGRRGQLWVHAAPLIARLELFCAGTLLWFALRDAAPPASHLSLVVGQIGLFAFLLSALPLLPSDGYRWLATYFARPALRADAFRTLTGLLLGRRDGVDAAPSGPSATTFYLLGVALTVAALGLVALVYADVATTGDVRLVTAALLLGLGVAVAAWIVALWNAGRGREIKALDAEGTRTVFSTWVGQPDLALVRPVSIGTVGKVFWAVVACALLAVAFLPYPYESGGTFEILPTKRTMVPVRTAGVVEQVLVHEGDWVKANQVLAKLSSDEQQRAISITNAELQHAKAQLAQLGGQAAAQDDSDDAALQQAIDAALGGGAPSGGAGNSAPAKPADSADAKKDQPAAKYTKTEAERAARAEVERLTYKLAYERDQLAQTQVRAPMEGRVMTPNVHLLTGVALRQGSELLSLADTRNLEAEINVPEADIGLVKVGDSVRLRPWSNEDREIDGTATEIAPAAQPRPYGMIVRVKASIPNQEAALRPAMTGYAKIDGEDMRVWEAFLRRIIRIVRVEIWSWIP